MLHILTTKGLSQIDDQKNMTYNNIEVVQPLWSLQPLLSKLYPALTFKIDYDVKVEGEGVEDTLAGDLWEESMKKGDAKTKIEYRIDKLNSFTYPSFFIPKVVSSKQTYSLTWYILVVEISKYTKGSSGIMYASDYITRSYKDGSIKSRAVTPFTFNIQTHKPIPGGIYNFPFFEINFLLNVFSGKLKVTLDFKKLIPYFIFDLPKLVLGSFKKPESLNNVK